MVYQYKTPIASQVEDCQLVILTI